MLVPISWLREYVDIEIPAEELAERLTLAGLEVAHIHYIGVPQLEIPGIQQPPSDHLVWSREKVLLGGMLEVKKHPNADRLVIAIVDIGTDEWIQCVTGAPNLFRYADQGPLSNPLWVAWAGSGAELWDGHSDAPKRMKLKGRHIRGIYNDSMVCSEKELGISSEHEGILVLENDGRFHSGQPLQDVLGDIIFDIELTPNLARCMSVLGVAREVAALLNVPLREPNYAAKMAGPSIKGQVEIDIQEPTLNPRFTFALLRNTQVQPSPWWLQWRLKLVGQRPINNIVDVTNYITVEVGQPLHPYDYDLLVERASGEIPRIHTRTPLAGERVTTLDQQVRELDEDHILVCDTAGALGLGGVIGGASTAIHTATHNVLLEAASWNYINTRRTMNYQKLHTEAGARFSRGVHAETAPKGVLRGIELMRQTGGGEVAEDIIDGYPLPQPEVAIHLTKQEVARLLGIDLEIPEINSILERLQFKTRYIDADTLHVAVPPHRIDISEDPVIGQADLIEEIARIYGYDRIPSTIMADAMPDQSANHELLWEERIRDLLVNYGLRENIGYRFTTPEQEAMLSGSENTTLFPKSDYVHITNPISVDKTVLRRSLLGGMLSQLVLNRRWRDSHLVFEIGPIFRSLSDQPLPQEETRLGILLQGTRKRNHWLDDSDESEMDFFEIKGLIHNLLDDLHVDGWEERRSNSPTYHPGKSVDIWVDNQPVASYGELHPLVARKFDLGGETVLVSEINLKALRGAAKTNFLIQTLPTTPPILQDIALIVAVQTTHDEIVRVIRRAGGNILRKVQCFDIYSGPPIPENRKSLAFNLTFQSDSRTLTVKEVAKVQQRIIRAAEKELGAQLRT